MKRGNPQQESSAVLPEQGHDLAPYPNLPCGAVLIVDDEMLVRRGVCRMLTECSSVESAASAEQAFLVLGETSFHAVVTDFQMTEQDGFWLLEKVRHLQPSARRVLMSSLQPPGLDDHQLSGLVQRFLAKPFSPTDLLSALEHEDSSIIEPGESDLAASV
ncbi:MAG: response regulator [Deltaproteobacteria bacterium]|nr:response regulator [Deltaproteobacteria bacterium]